MRIQAAVLHHSTKSKYIEKVVHNKGGDEVQNTSKSGGGRRHEKIVGSYIEGQKLACRYERNRGVQGKEMGQDMCIRKPVDLKGFRERGSVFVQELNHRKIFTRAPGS